MQILADVTTNTKITESECRGLKIIPMEPIKNRTIQFQNMHVLEKNKAHTMNCLIFYSMDAETLIKTIQSN